ncbi:unnamed protein product, partial [Symbiodinium microadriaticum]
MLVVQTDNPAAEVSVAALAVRSADMAAPARSQWHDQRHKQEPLPEHHDGGVATAAADDIGDDDDDDDDDDDGDVGLGGDDVDLDGDDDVLPMTTIIFRCARMQENATLGPLEKAVEQGLIVHYARALMLDGNGRVLVGHRDAPGLSCRQSYEIGAATICKPGEAPLPCALRALAEEMQSEDAHEFPAAVKEQKGFMLSLDDGSVHQQLVDFVCVWLPDGFPWKSVYTSSWTFDKPAA